MANALFKNPFGKIASPSPTPTNLTAIPTRFIGIPPTLSRSVVPATTVVRLTA